MRLATHMVFRGKVRVFQFHKKTINSLKPENPESESYREITLNISHRFSFLSTRFKVFKILHEYYPTISSFYLSVFLTTMCLCHLKKTRLILMLVSFSAQQLVLSFQINGILLTTISF